MTPSNNMISQLLLLIITIFMPPVGVFFIAGCGADLLINICLTVLGVIPGHVHAFYLEYVYFKREEQSAVGNYDNTRAPGVYSDNVQTGGRGYGTLPPPAGAPVN
ncbi:hypothetical protein D6D05_02193 [Aureobasidium pullulans]|nr:hypothetical protein D6D05_02193 [Aureobasidium pullulans]THY31486.1 hypothetical protein D6D00_02200 [Aureobasidium pullulans]TIA00345.1 hypothetical protein D6C88_00209 [Aureobasidium pullulans]